MENKRHNWINYRRQGIICEIKVLDEDNRKLDFFKFHINDKNSEKKITEILKKKYALNLKPEVKTEDSINNLNKNISW